MGQIQAGDQVIVELASVIGIQADGKGQVGIQSRVIKPDSPPLQSTVGGLASGQHQTDDQFVVEGKQICFAVPLNLSAQLRDGLLCACDNFRMQLAQTAVDLQGIMVAQCMKTHQFVSSAEAAKALCEGVGARHARRLIDDEAR